MATIGQTAIVPVRTWSGGTPAMITLPEAAGQSFALGELVTLVDGKVTECGADPVAIFGVAAEDASGTEDTDIMVFVADDDTIFEANVYHSTVGSAVTAQDLVGKRYGLYRDTTNSRVYVDIESTTTRVYVLKLSPKDAVGDTYGRVLFTFVGSYRQYGSTS